MPNKVYTYSNGFDLSVVSAAMIGRLGWIQPTVAGSITLSDANKGSKSGRYFNDDSFHAVVTPGNILSCQENPSMQPAAFNEYLQQLQKSAILRSLNNVFNEPEYIEQVQAYTRYNRNVDVPIGNTGQVVGYEIRLSNRFDVAEQVNSVSLYFDGDVTFPLYLFKDGGRAPIWQQAVTAIAYEATHIDIPDLYMGGPNSTYFLCYFQSDLGAVRAIQEDACFNCLNMAAVTPFTAPVTGSLQFDRTQRSYPAKAQGLNIQISSFRDWTRKIKAEPGLFDNLVGMTMAYMVMEKVIYTARSNGTERILKDQLVQIGIQFDLNGTVPVSDAPQVKGLKQRIDAEAKRVKGALIKKPIAQTVNYADY